MMDADGFVWVGGNYWLNLYGGVLPTIFLNHEELLAHFLSPVGLNRMEIFSRNRCRGKHKVCTVVSEVQYWMHAVQSHGRCGVYGK
jgi:hypothetical protein